MSTNNYAGKQMINGRNWGSIRFPNNNFEISRTFNKLEGNLDT